MGSNEEHSLMIGETEVDSTQIDPKRSRFPCCIVWSPLPLLSWFFLALATLEYAGRMELSWILLGQTLFALIILHLCWTFIDSSAHDSEDDLMQNSERREIRTWDDALRKSTQEYQHESYNILTCNCHSFVANSLNKLKFQGGN
ncbi:UNVERIFIED_CONTAM: protein RTE1 [Sesamum calycinum]|uniref:Protein RTE1 n=1 Tax=Sesamum calycinum TaxID=2727403 RepID=A0AAW2PMJ0_9LAMI